jgi:hypothetical protein
MGLLKKIRKGVSGVGRTVGSALHSGGETIEALGAELDDTARQARKKKREKEAGAATEAAAKLGQTQTAAALERRRRPLRLKGARSTRRSQITPDIFASSLGAPKTLLGQ